MIYKMVFNPKLGLDDDYRNFVGSYTLNEMIEEMHEVAKVKEKLEAQLAEVNKAYDFLRITLIPEKMNSDGVRTVTLGNIGRVSLTADVYASIVAGMKEDAYNWLQDTGHGDLIQPYVQPSTLKAMLKKALEKGEDIPETLFKVTPYQRASITAI